ncbi:MAG: hypothetical protein NXI15_14725 [Gammaproteobacteria bacterium]|nr:hypothetical protein [Gammaproteobacteria bacterium]
MRQPVKVLKIVISCLMGAALLCAGLIAWLLLPVLSTPDFMTRKGVLVSAIETDAWAVEHGRVQQVSLLSSSGLAVDLALLVPEQPLPGRPLLVMLGGQETGRQAVDILPDTRGVAVAALSYPFGTIPHRDGLALAMALPRIQRGILDTPPAALLAMDYLAQRADLNPGRIELAGISFGAFLASVPAVLDTRVQRLWLIHGAGDPQDVISAGLDERVPFAILREAIAWLLVTFAGAHHLSPEYWVGDVAPRPLVVINADADSALTDAAVAALHDALRPPFEVLWSPGDHVHPKRPQTIEYITGLLFSRINLAAQRAQVPPATPQAQPGSP